MDMLHSMAYPVPQIREKGILVSSIKSLSVEMFLASSEQRLDSNNAFQ